MLTGSPPCIHGDIKDCSNNTYYMTVYIDTTQSTVGLPLTHTHTQYLLYETTHPPKHSHTHSDEAETKATALVFDA